MKKHKTVIREFTIRPSKLKFRITELLGKDEKSVTGETVLQRAKDVKGINADISHAILFLLNENIIPEGLENCLLLFLGTFLPNDCGNASIPYLWFKKNGSNQGWNMATAALGLMYNRSCRLVQLVPEF